MIYKHIYILTYIIRLRLTLAQRQDRVRMGAIAGGGEFVHRTSSRVEGRADRMHYHSKAPPFGDKGQPAFH